MNINLTIIGQILAFIAFVAFCMRYVWPPILAAMEERQQKIADGLAAADRASHDLELAQKEAVDRLSEAKKEAASIVEALISVQQRLSMKQKSLRLQKRIG